MKIEHVAMYVNELESARDFFVKYLGGVSNDGYHNKSTDFRSYFISFDDGARLEIMTKQELEDPVKPLNRTGYVQHCFFRRKHGEGGRADLKTESGRV
jgi:lactoylglutathione lyase